MFTAKKSNKIDWINVERHVWRLAKIRADSIKAENALAEPDAMAEKRALAETLAARIDSKVPFATGKVISNDGLVVGYAIYVVDQWRDATDLVVPHVRLTEIVVDPEYRRRGIGTLLLRNILEQYVDEMGFSAVAMVHEKNLAGQCFLREAGERRFAVHTRGRFLEGRSLAPCRSARRDLAKRLRGDEYLFLLSKSRTAAPTVLASRA